MRVLLLIPSVLKPAVEPDAGPLMDYYALAAAIRRGEGDGADLVDYAAVEEDQDFFVRVARRFGGRDAALAMVGFRRRKLYDKVFTNGENVGIPLALLYTMVKTRPGHVTIGHR